MGVDAAGAVGVKSRRPPFLGKRPSRSPRAFTGHSFRGVEFLGRFLTSFDNTPPQTLTPEVLRLTMSPFVGA
jgi:hypothetical protein